MGMILCLGYLAILRDLLGFYSGERLFTCGTENRVRLKCSTLFQKTYIINSAKNLDCNEKLKQYSYCSGGGRGLPKLLEKAATFSGFALLG